MHSSTHPPIHACIHTHIVTYRLVHTTMHVSMHTCGCPEGYIYMYDICTYICMYVCMYVCIGAHTHTQNTVFFLSFVFVLVFVVCTPMNVGISILAQADAKCWLSETLHPESCTQLEAEVWHHRRWLRRRRRPRWTLAKASSLFELGNLRSKDVSSNIEVF